jgi:hypothetical protein
MRIAWEMALSGFYGEITHRQLLLLYTVPRNKVAYLPSGALPSCPAAIHQKRTSLRERMTRQILVEEDIMAVQNYGIRG